MSVLEEQGRLDEVDEGLLHRIQLTIQQNKGQRKVEKRVGKQSPILSKPPTTPSHSVLNLARARQQQLFGARRPQLAEQHSRFPFSHEAERVGGQCQAFKTENAILKKQLLAAQTKLQQVGPVGNINQLRRNQENPVTLDNGEADPLSKLFQEAKRKEEKATVDLYKVHLSSTLITPSPTISTILDTITTVTTTTVTLTKEIGIYYHGKRIPTHILDTEVQVQTLTSTLSSTVEITPTPTWQTVTITPTATQPPPTQPPAPDIAQLLAVQSNEHENKIPRSEIQNKNPYHDTLRSVGGVKANVVEIPKALDNVESLKKYLNHIKKLQEEQVSTIQAEPLISLPSTTVSTMYLSGSIPGQYTTSLVTISLNNQENVPNRIKRQIIPSVHEPIKTTVLADPSKSFSEEPHELHILSSFNEEEFYIPEKRKESENCSDKKTVTVTVTQSCLP